MSSDNEVSQLRSSTQYDSNTFFLQEPAGDSSPPPLRGGAGQGGGEGNIRLLPLYLLEEGEHLEHLLFLIRFALNTLNTAPVHSNSLCVCLWQQETMLRDNLKTRVGGHVGLGNVIHAYARSSKCPPFSPSEGSEWPMHRRPAETSPPCLCLGASLAANQQPRTPKLTAMANLINFVCMQLMEGTKRNTDAQFEIFKAHPVFWCSM